MCVCVCERERERDSPGCDSRQGQKIFIFSSPGTTQPPVQCLPRVSSPGYSGLS